LFTYLRLACWFLRSALRRRFDVALENLALRQQLVVLARSCRRPRLTPADRLFWTLALAVLVALALRARPRPARAWWPPSRVRVGGRLTCVDTDEVLGTHSTIDSCVRGVHYGRRTGTGKRLPYAAPNLQFRRQAWPPDTARPGPDTADRQDDGRFWTLAHLLGSG
jgi:hypothetical protein